MSSQLVLFIAKFGDNDYRFALSNSHSNVIAFPNQYFYDKKKSFGSMSEAITQGSKSFESMGVILNSVHYLGDMKSSISQDWESGDVIQF